MSVRLSFVFTACIYVVFSKQCYWNSDQYLYYGSKTLYDDVRGDLRDVPALEGCSPVSLWILGRHGTRNPKAKYIVAMKEAMRLKYEIIRSHDEGRGEMCAQDIENLKNWNWNETIDKTNYHLIARGYHELSGIGRRVHEKFLTVFDKLDYYNIRSAKEHRTEESAKAFVSGLGEAFHISDPLERDEVLAPYMICPVHIDEVWLGDRPRREMDRYYKSEEFTQLIEDVQRRTGLPDSVSVTNVTGLYDLCRFFRPYSADNRSPWCALFSHQDLMVLEYLNDLKRYFNNGYGHPINPILGHFALKDLHEFFENAINSSNRTLKAYFTHDSLVQIVHCALGLFRDYPEISGFERVVGRKWRTSINAPFAANIMAVLHRCSKVVDSTPYRVQFFINEKELHLCDNRTCSWKDFDKKFQPFLNATLDVCIKKNF